MQLWQLIHLPWLFFFNGSNPSAASKPQPFWSHIVPEALFPHLFLTSQMKGESPKPRPQHWGWILIQPKSCFCAVLHYNIQHSQSGENLQPCFESYLGERSCKNARPASLHLDVSAFLAVPNFFVTYWWLGAKLNYNIQALVWVQFGPR